MKTTEPANCIRYNMWGCLHEHLKRPAYKNLTNEQAKLAVELCEDIINGKANLNQLNQQSLSWRGKLKAVN